MSRLFNSQAVILILVMFAMYIVYSNIVAPLMQEEEYAAERPDMLGFEEEEEQVVDAESHALSPVDTNDLFWDDSPSRDPFIFHAKLKQGSVRSARKLRDSHDGGVSVQGGPRMAGLVAGVDSKLAVVDGRIIEVGDRIGGHTVLDINTRGVLLVDRESRSKHYLKPE